MSLYDYYAVDDEKSRDGSWVRLSFGGKVRIRRQSDPKVTAVVLAIQQELGDDDDPDVFSIQAKDSVRRKAIIELIARGIVVDWDEKHTDRDGEPIRCTPDAVRQVAADIDDWRLEVLLESNKRSHFRPDAGNSRDGHRGRRSGRGAKRISRSSNGGEREVSPPLS